MSPLPPHTLACPYMNAPYRHSMELLQTFHNIMPLFDDVSYVVSPLSFHVPLSLPYCPQDHHDSMQVHFQSPWLATPVISCAITLQALASGRGPDPGSPDGRAVLILC